MLPFEEVYAEFEKIVRLVGPDHYYQRRDDLTFSHSCMYVHVGEGPYGQDVLGCIIAWWLHRFRGVSLDDLMECEGQGISMLMQEREWGRRLRAQLDDQTALFLGRVQDGQDRGERWSEVLPATRESIYGRYLVPA